MREPSIEDVTFVSSSPPSGSGVSSAAFKDVGDDGMIVDCEENVVKAVACAAKPKKRGTDSFILLLCMYQEEMRR